MVNNRTPFRRNKKITGELTDNSPLRIPVFATTVAPPSLPDAPSDIAARISPVRNSKMFIGRCKDEFCAMCIPLHLTLGDVQGDRGVHGV